MLYKEIVTTYILALYLSIFTILNFSRKELFPLDGASVLACAYQLTVQSENPKNFEH